jgi:hypothetical protein
MVRVFVYLWVARAPLSDWLPADSVRSMCYCMTGTVVCPSVNTATSFSRHSQQSYTSLAHAHDRAHEFGYNWGRSWLTLVQVQA